MSTPSQSTPAPAPTKSQVISALVQALRSGEISKAELFDKLSRLHRGEAVTISGYTTSVSTPAGVPPSDEIGLPEPDLGVGAPSTAATPTTASAVAGAAGVTPGGSSDRAATMQRLLEQSRRQTHRDHTSAPPSTAPPSSSVQSQSQSQSQPHPHAYAPAHGSDTPRSTASSVYAGDVIPPPPVPVQYQADLTTPARAGLSHAVGTPISIDQFMSAQSAAPLSARRGVAPPGVPSSSSSSSSRRAAGRTPVTTPRGAASSAGGRRTAPGSARASASASASRASRSAAPARRRPVSAPRQRPPARGGEHTPIGLGAERGDMSYWEDAPRPEVRSDMEECTFKPSIRPLPASYGSQKALEGVPFEERVQQWKQHKEEEVERKRQLEESKEFDGCTFQPSINERSRRSAERSRPDAGVPVSERLYNYASKQSRSVSATRERPRHAYTSVETKEEEELRTECTFKPKINRSRDATPVRARYLDHTQSSKPTGKSDVLPSGMEECTFTPRVNSVPREMGSAQLYLQADPFERLSRTRSAVRSESVTRERPSPMDAEPYFDDGDGDLSRPVLDMSTFLMAAENRSGASVRSELNHSTSRRSVSAPRGRPSHADDESLGSSLKLSKSERDRRFKDFLARQAAAERRKAQKLKQTKDQLSFSHKPTVSAGSARIAKQSNIGTFLQRVSKDSLKKEHRSLQAQAQEAKDDACTFKPKINERSARRPARSVVEMSRGDMLKKETAQRLMRLKAEQEQLDGLTFHPEINPVSKKIEGCLRILSEPETYLQRVQREQKLFSDRQRRATQEAEMAEYAECSFEPEIHDAPGYIKRIARSMALTRAARPPTNESKRPDWR